MLRVLLMLAVIWWMYGGYAWLTNAVSAEQGRVPARATRGDDRLPGRVARHPDGVHHRRLVFGLGYLLVVLVHVTLFGQAGAGAIRGMRVVGPRNVGAALVIILAGALASADRAGGLLLWGAAVLILVASAAASTESGFEIGPAHFVERHGLVVIIALGESVIAVATGTSAHPLGAASLGIAALGLLLSVALWWVYFDRDDSAAVRALEQAPAAERPLKVKVAYGYWHYALLLGIIATAAGMKDAVSAPFHHVHIPASLALAGGVALYLAGHAGVRRTLLTNGGRRACCGPRSRRWRRCRWTARHRGVPARGARARAQRDSAARVIDVTRVNASAGFTGPASLRRSATRRPRRAVIGRSGKARLAAYVSTPSIRMRPARDSRACSRSTAYVAPSTPA